MSCTRCSDWGRTLGEYEDLTVGGVRCPDCRRPTWPNPVVNLPAGSATAWSSTRRVETVRLRDPLHAAPTEARPEADDVFRRLRDPRDSPLVVPGSVPPGLWGRPRRGRSARG